MGKAIKPLRVVLETNVVLSALLFSRGRVSWLRGAMRAGTVVPVVSRVTVQELVRVLEYPKFALSHDDREELLADFLPFAEIFPGSLPSLEHVKCRDPDDQIFLELAIAAGADAVVTGDADLLALAGNTEVSILTPAEFRRRVEREG
jgi:putative PIN family toxin of toxin-antitoxin system